MVNAGFPSLIRYGFELVHTALCRVSHRPNRQQSKIYAESNHSNFSQIFEDLTSMQTLAIYGPLLVITARQLQQLR
jgi:hypothetical protein